LVTVIVVNLVMSRLVIRRLEEVAQFLTRFGRGQIELRLPADRPDEIGQLVVAFNDMGQRLQSEEIQNHSLTKDLRRLASERYELLKRLITAQEEERRRVARDLHDGLGQDLAGLAFGLEVVERMGTDQPEPTLAHIRQLRVQIAETTNRVYDMILALRPSVLDDLGLAPALRLQAERTLKDAGVQFEVEASGLTRRLPSEIETALFRTFQEALHNIARHAGASRVRLSLAAHDGQFEGEIVDDGRGFDPETIRPNGYTPRGLGLLGMQERMAQCGGALEIFSRPGAGTRLQIRIPIPEAACD
ncbi:MAG TPA: sensor histidine kinase, partial [Candidatus Acidoferrales bacterium]